MRHSLLYALDPAGQSQFVTQVPSTSTLNARHFRNASEEEQDT